MSSSANKVTCRDRGDSFPDPFSESLRAQHHRANAQKKIGTLRNVEKQSGQFTDVTFTAVVAEAPSSAMPIQNIFNGIQPAFEKLAIPVTGATAGVVLGAEAGVSLGALVDAAQRSEQLAKLQIHHTVQQKALEHWKQIEKGIPKGSAAHQEALFARGSQETLVREVAEEMKALKKAPIIGRAAIETGKRGILAGGAIGLTLGILAEVLSAPNAE